MVVKVASSIAEPDLTRKRPRLKVLVKKPADENNVLGTKALLLKACQLSREVPKMDCGFEKSPRFFNQTIPVIGNSTVGLKRRPEEALKGPVSKRMKMDRSATLLCQSVLEKLMHNQLSYPFRVPVDPVAWSIDDYFDIVKEPMDLGTIKQKLKQLKYICAEEFEADVRLTFSNAMLYNPPDHWIHQDASHLIREFDRLWKPVKIKLDREYKDVRQRDSESNFDKTACDVKGEHLGTTTSHQAQFSGKTLPQLEKSPVKKSSTQVQCSGLKPVLDCKPKDTYSSKSFTDCKPKDTYSSKSFTACKAKGTSSSKSLTDCAPRDSLIPKSHSDRPGPASHLHKNACPISARFKCDTATGNMIADNDFADMIADNDFAAAKVKHTSTLQSCRFGQAYAGTLSLMEVDHGFGNVPSTTDSFCATAKGLQDKSDIELSPSRAQRVAKLKSRFAETIMKAQHHTLLEPGAEADITNRQQEKQILQRQQHEDTSNLEAKIRAAKLAAQSKQEFERKRQRQEAREAGRRAIREMERSISVENNFQVMRDLEALIGTPLVVMFPDHTSRTMWNYEGINDLRSPLEELGLYIKEEYSASYDFDDAFLEQEPEEGELIL